MWSKQQAVAEPPAVSPSAAASTPVVGFNQPSTGKPSSAPARGGARLGASIQIRGEVTGSEDLQIDGIVEGPIRIKGHELTVGPAAQLTSEIHAGDERLPIGSAAACLEQAQRFPLVRNALERTWRGEALP